MTFEMKTRAWRHQAKIFEERKDDEFFALFWEMSLGKTKVVLDVAAYRYLERGDIQSLLIVAPNSVYSNWPVIEMPVHLAAPHVSLRYRSGGSYEKKVKRLLYLDRNTIDPAQRLRVVAMSYDSLCTEEGQQFAERLVNMYPAMMVLDESTAIKDRATERAKTCKFIGNMCVIRWICTGTPSTESPFNYFSQFEFLDPDFWKRAGYRSWSAFKSEFGVYESRRMGPRTFQKVTGFRNLQTLRSIIAPVSSRLLKDDSEVELPPKLYSVRAFSLSERQREVYEVARKGLIQELESGAIVDATMALTRTTKLQQICSGFVTAETEGDVDPNESFAGIDRSVGEPLLKDEEGEDTWATGDPAQKDDSAYSLAIVEQGFEQAMKPPPQHVELYSPQDIDLLSRHAEKLNPDLAEFVTREAENIRAFEVKRQVVDVVSPAENPRLELLVEILEECHPQKVIVFCRFTRDVELICDRLGDSCYRYDGRVKQIDREASIAKFRDPLGARVLVANVHALSMGLTLTIAKRAIYFSNSFSLEKRLQSEDRIHRPGQNESVHIIDIVAEDTIDEKIVETLRKKFDVAAEVIGDKLREWISIKRQQEF